MELEIQTRSTELDPSWRDLIERSVARLTGRYPEILRLHVTLHHGTHHRVGSEVVSILANVEGATMRAEKEEEDATAALHAAFAALEVELERHQSGRRA
jgi:ribosomal subunit interface protein